MRSTKIRLMVLITGMFILLSVFTSGCGDSNSAASSETISAPASQGSTASQELTLGDLPGELNLSYEQIAKMESALAHLSNSRDERHGHYIRFPGTDRFDGSPPDGPIAEDLPPIAHFLEECSTFLEPGQLLCLAENLSKRMESNGLEQPRDLSRFQDHMMDRLTSVLRLSEEQETHFKEMLYRTGEEVKRLHETIRDGCMTPGQAIIESESLVNEIESEMQSILTTDQYSQMKSLDMERTASMIGRHLENINAHTSRHVEFLGITLNLSDQQREEIAGIFETCNQERSEILQGVLNDEIARLTAGFMMFQISEQVETEIIPVLAPGQIDIFEQLWPMLIPGRHLQMGRGPSMIF
ncbi:MAG: hypothetical protein KJ970_02940 [Candidatus Eisenbacteria bacterium]|uniref:Uncharacterized protein n=1 Tax=Eiseniibacteriota bacterium TaxID=2212470 RepID=A0A948W2E7_UNCEI|nr:hypothetical protein [Candidatus Eisenbacteria bacterium]MBU1948287.1 hypothetical protein [Candidatus Eisenbacteria bacterium]MBU2689857.1 hypothetical protein [Candidatus Eisenbacteria bacterium]